MPKGKVNKTIGITVRFFTNDLEVLANKKQVEACWDSGSVNLEANPEKGIKPVCIPFNCTEDIPLAIKECLRQGHVRLVCWNMRSRVCPKYK